MKIKNLKKLIKLMESSDLVELSLSQKEESIFLRRREGEIVPKTIVQTVEHEPISTAKKSVVVQEKKDSYREIKSPMVATFYTSSSPDSPAFVHKGQKIQEGETLCILEAMKLMNEFKSEFSGIIIDVLVKNGEAVEYGQSLFLMDSNV